MSRDQWRLPGRSLAKLRLAVTAGLFVVGLLALAESPLGPGGAQAATTLTVTTTADVPADGGVDGVCSLRAAVRFANDPATGDPDCGADGGGPYTIVLDGGSTYVLTVAGDDDTGLAGDLDVAAGVDLTIEAVGGLATVRQTVADRVVDVDAASLTLAGIRITGGSPPAGESGGGIFNFGALELIDSEVSGNRADQGGGILSGVAAGVSVTLTDSAVVDNEASSAGGGIRFIEGTLTVTNSAVGRNTSGSVGGGISLQEAGVPGISGPTLVLTDSTVDGNHASFQGGGIHSIGGVLTLLRSSVSDNTVDFTAGGIFTDLTATLTDSTLSGNIAPAGTGGGMVNFGEAALGGTTVTGNSASSIGGGIHNSGQLTLTNSFAGGNTSGLHGGGIYNTSNGTLLVAFSTIADNTAADFGGGISNDGAVELTKVTLSGNESSFGGGMDNFGTTTMANVMVSGNEAAQEAGGIYVDAGATLALTNVTLAFNQAPLGGGILSFAPAEATTVVNTIVAQNDETDCEGAVTSLGHNLDSDGTCFDGSVAGDTPGGVALLGALVDNGGPTWTHALLPGSQAIDAGDDAVCAAPPVDGRDQRGVGRPQDGDEDGVAVCDIGAYEREPTDGINNTNNNVIDIDNDNANDNANRNDNANTNQNANSNQNDNANENAQDQDNGQGQDNTNDQQNNIDSSPEVNIDFGD